jgi:hypothetical protein
MIRVNDDYVILVDTLNYTPCRDGRKMDKAGKPIYQAIGYFSTLEHALRGIIKDMNARAFEVGVYSLQEALEIIQQSNTVFTNMLREVMEAGVEDGSK